MRPNTLIHSYRTLGLGREASLDDVRRAYRTFARRMHPDLNPAPGEAERFKEITAAYNALVAHLSSPARTQRLPRRPRPAAEPQPTSQASQAEREAARARWKAQATAWRTARSAREAAQAEAAASAREAAKAAEQARQQHTRPQAEPLPRQETPPPEIAAEQRRWWQRLAPRRGRDLDITRRLPLKAEQILNGGRLRIALERKIVDRDGQSRLIRDTLTVEVPPGARRGDRLRVEGQGHVGPQGAGDLHLILEPATLAGFARVNADLHGEAAFSSEDLLAGGVVQAQGVDGVIKVRLPAGSRPGTRLRLRGQGLPTWGGEARGDLILTLQAMGA